MRHTTQAGLDLIKEYESFSPTVYICPAGYATIGWGHVVRKGDPEVVTKEQADVILAKDVEVAERGVLRLISVPLSDGQFDALVSFTFNLGSGTLQRSSLRAKINREEFEDASEVFGKYVYARGKKLKGLIRRRESERLLFLS
jgi:lysozyme